MEENTLLSRLDGLDIRFEEVATLITDPSVISDQKRYVKLTKEYHDREDEQQSGDSALGLLFGEFLDGRAV